MCGIIFGRMSRGDALKDYGTGNNKISNRKLCFRASVGMPRDMFASVGEGFANLKKEPCLGKIVQGAFLTGLAAIFVPLTTVLFIKHVTAGIISPGIAIRPERVSRGKVLDG